MGLQSARASLSSNISSNEQVANKKVGWVYDVILDENNEYVKSKGYASSFIGSIRFRTSDNLTPSEKDLPVAHPFNKNFKDLPIINELVEIYEFESGNYAYRRIGNEVNPSLTAGTNAISSYFKPKKDEKQTSSNYKNVSNTGISRTNQNENSQYDSFGKYYDAQNGIHKLKLYEGDSLIESRFGQSIRFSGFNNNDNKFSPTIIIRNGENSENKSKEVGVSVIENINKDGSVIVLSSNTHQLEFLPGTVDDKNKSNFETKPDSFGDYPTKLIGDQILINSGRIILSAKESEMIFFSKKNYGFISDGGLSIDNKLGIDISVGDDINVITNDRDVNIVSGKGSIFLGNDSLEPMVKGQSLVDTLGALIDAIGQMQFLTPSGPTAIGPVNIADFGQIKSSLNSILSKLNQTA
jgi:predicted small secreted protein